MDHASLSHMHMTSSELPADPTTPVDQAPDQPADQPGAQFTDPGAIRQFVTGGHATVTIVGRANRYTFRVDRVDPSGSYSQPAWFISLLTGPDNLSDYHYVGMFDPASGQIRLTRKSRYTAESTPVRAWNWIMAIVWSGRMPAAGSGAEVWHIGRCGRCGRALTVPASIASGFGPECMAKMNGGE